MPTQVPAVGGLYFIDVERTLPVSAAAATQLYYLTLSDNLPDNLALNSGRVDLHWVLLAQVDSTARNCALSGGTVIQISSNSLQWGGSSATSCSALPVQLDPLLGPLQDNGGLTLTRKPGAGSGARDRSSPCDRPEDQRGATRPNLNHLNCDIGAVEVGGAYLLQVAIGADNQGSVSAGDLPAPLSPIGFSATITDCADAAGLGNCVAFYSPDPTVSTVTLTATPLPGFAFDHWEGPGCGTNPQAPQAQVRMSQSRACMAHFRVGPPVVTAVPTLSAWGLMLLALLAVGLGSARLRRRSM